MRVRPRLMALALALSVAGAALKIYGGARYSSRAVLVDGFTCVANIASGALVLLLMVRSLEPPDEDHPYGHSRLLYLGTLVVVLVYTATLGFSLGLIVWGGPSGRVGVGSAYYALAGGGFYAVSVAVARLSGPGGASYAGFTFSEVLEGLVSAASAYAGARFSSVYDLAGAALIAGYIAVETYREARVLSGLITDYTAPRVYWETRRALEEAGFDVVSLRLRPLVPGRYVGDAKVRARAPPDVARLLALEVSENLRIRGVELAIELVEG